MKCSWKTALVPVVILIIVGLAFFYFRPLTLNKLVQGFDSISSFEIIEWTGANDSNHTSNQGNIRALQDFFRDAQVRRVVGKPSAFPLLTGESYLVFGRDREGRIILYCSLYKGYILLNNTACYQVISPSSFEPLHLIVQ